MFRKLQKDFGGALQDPQPLRSLSRKDGVHQLARLLKRVLDIDIEHCPNCGGASKIIATIEDPPVFVAILSHLGLPTRAPARIPARRVDLFRQSDSENRLPTQAVGAALSEFERAAR